MIIGTSMPCVQGPFSPLSRTLASNLLLSHNLRFLLPRDQPAARYGDRRSQVSKHGFFQPPGSLQTPISTKLKGIRGSISRYRCASAYGVWRQEAEAYGGMELPFSCCCSAGERGWLRVCLGLMFWAYWAL
ncbi:uncharacterized protein [Gossypium hirsutum]|uniref:Uncharacterized protein n=1 Tax=Gossypium hirsutum TaxID=3635 RepID=A0ABM2ZM78_GOSHI|nr:uncharacterized protein LOC121214068 [Gossypium hirsutum]